MQHGLLEPTGQSPPRQAHTRHLRPARPRRVQDGPRTADPGRPGPGPRISARCDRAGRPEGSAGGPQPRRDHRPGVGRPTRRRGQRAGVSRRAAVHRGHQRHRTAQVVRRESSCVYEALRAHDRCPFRQRTGAATSGAADAADSPADHDGADYARRTCGVRRRHGEVVLADRPRSVGPRDGRFRREHRHDCPDRPDHRHRRYRGPAAATGPLARDRRPARSGGCVAPPRHPR